ncbi:MAG: hypothetical protein K0Q59_3951 [Paenibacillus sp.]|nr:hypothetical protein [Paenibacillus sp.]
MSRWSCGGFVAVACICAASLALYEWRGGESTAFLFYGTASLLGLTLVACLGLRGLKAERMRMQPAMFAGEDLVVDIEIVRPSRIPSGWIVATDVWTDGRAEYRHSRLLFPGFHASLRFRYKLNRLPRGYCRFVQIEVEAGDWMGLVRNKSVFAASAEIAVCPKPLALDDYGVMSDTGRAVTGFPDAATPVLTGVRPYVAGDPLPRIHWKASAKTGVWQTKQTDPLQSEQVAIMLDNAAGAYAGPGGEARFEACVRAAAGLMVRSFRQNSFSGLYMGSGFSVTRADIAAARHVLCSAQADGAEPAADLLLRSMAQWPPGCTVAIVTAHIDEALIRVARIMRSASKQLAVWFVADRHNGGAGDDRDRYWARQLETCGCRMTVIQTPAGRVGGSGGAEDVIA